ncbi:MAG: hypothetical protein J6A96_05720 [Clostridia bacterium]|nr:hypothetical protein [Clostridia bacterium]
MKKRFTLFLSLIGILACLFAISVSAEVVTFETYQEKTNLTYDETELVLFDDGIAYPSYYIFADDTSFKTDYAWLNEQATKNYSDANVVELCVPTGVTTGGYFKKDSSFSKITKLNTGKTLTKTNGDFYQNQTLTHVTFGEGYTNGGLSTYFFNGAVVEYVVFSDNSQMTTLPNQFFGNLSTLKGVYFGNTITAIDDGTFDKMTSSNIFLMNTPNDTEPPLVYYFKSNIIEANFYGFKGNSATTTWVFPKGINSFSGGINIDSSSNIPKNFVFLTDSVGSVVLNDAIGSSKLNSTKIYFPNISSSDATSMSVVPKTTYFFGDGKKASYNGGFGEFTDMLESEHIHSPMLDVNTAPTCTEKGLSQTQCFCGIVKNSVYKDATGHNSNNLNPLVIAWIYENNNYFSNAKYQHKCEDCNALYLGEVVENSYLFIADGYSIPEATDSSAISHTIKIHKSGIDGYKATGADIKYGTVAAVGDALGTPISIVNGELECASQAVIADMTGTDYVKLVIKISNIPSATDVNCNAFVAVGTKVYYLCGNQSLSAAEPKRLPQ